MPFLGKTPSQIVDPEVDIDGGSIDGTAIGATSASTATVTTFTSTGIDDNATSTALTINSSSNVGIGVTPRTDPRLTISGQLDLGGSNRFYYIRENVSADALEIGARISSDTSDSSHIYMTAAGNVGIGVTDPDEALEVVGSIKQSGSNAFPLQVDTPSFVYYPHYNTAHVAYYKQATHPANSNEYHYYWRTSDSGSSGGANETTWMTLNTGATHGGKLHLTGGVSFASNFASAHTLDDYEEGTWTPVLEADTSSGTPTYAIQNGKYTKIGNVVSANFRIRFSGAVTGFSGTLRINGLPFIPTAGYYHPGPVGYTTGWTNAPSAVYTQINTGYMRLSRYSNAGVALLSNTDLNATSVNDIIASVVYKV